MFVRVKDKSTGHEFDVPDSDPRIGTAFRRLSKDHYPPSVLARRPKHNVGPKPGPPIYAPSVRAEETKEENDYGRHSIDAV